MIGKQVVIEGSMTPCSELSRGQRRTVTFTDRIERLVGHGYMVVVEVLDAEPSWPESESPLIVPDDETASADTEQLGDDDEESVLEPPAGNASRSEWVSFLRAMDVPSPADATRDELKAIWRGNSDY